MNYYLDKKNILTLIVLCVGYILLGSISVHYLSMPSGIAIAWLPNSLLLAFFLTKQSKEWKYALPFILLAEIIADYGTFSLMQAVQFGSINIFETTVAAYFIKRLSGDTTINFGSTKHVILFFFIGLNIMPSMSALFGAAVYFTQLSTNNTFFELWRIWFFGDAVGILLLTPLMILLKEKYKTLQHYRLSIQNIMTILATLYLAKILFSISNTHFSIPTTPLILILALLWIVYKQCLLPGLLVAAAISSIAIFYTTHAAGPFMVFETKGAIIYLQEYIASFMIITLFFGVLNNEISESKEKLKKWNKTLEEKVKEKTQSLIKANEKLEQLASKDSLTGVYNRRAVDDCISQETKKSKRYKNNLCVMMLDIDHFKEVNDLHGHQVGDDILVQVVDIISQNIREVDILGRWGGEEFIIVLPQTKLEEASIVAENIRKKIESHTFDKVGKKTVSLGVCQFHPDEDPTLCIKRADDALYEAKNTGRNKVIQKFT